MSRLFILVAALGLSGCIIHKDSPPPVEEYNGNITFYWSFAGKTCTQARDVDRVRITLDGPDKRPLKDDGYFKCSPAGVDGITLQDFLPGAYTYRVEGLDYSGAVIFTANGSLRVNGSVEVQVNLAAVSSTGRMQVYWRFLPDGVEKACAAAGIANSTGVSKVRVYINSEPVQELSCTQNDSSGKAVQAWAWERNPGSYQVAIDGVIVNGGQEQVWYTANQTVTVLTGQTQNVTFDMLPVAAGARFIPVLKGYTTCAAAGVEAFSILLSDYDNPPNTTEPFWSGKCDTVLRDGFFWDFLPTAQSYDLSTGRWRGTWTVTIEAWDKAESVHKVVAKTTKQVYIVGGYKDQSFPVDLVR